MTSGDSRERPAEIASAVSGENPYAVALSRGNDSGAIVRRDEPGRGLLRARRAIGTRSPRTESFRHVWVGDTSNCPEKSRSGAAVEGDSGELKEARVGADLNAKTSIYTVLPW